MTKINQLIENSSEIIKKANLILLIIKYNYTAVMNKKSNYKGEK